MPLKFTYTDRTTAIIEHERGKYVCSLTVAAPVRQVCPIRHPNWKKGGWYAVAHPALTGLERSIALY